MTFPKASCRARSKSEQQTSAASHVTVPADLLSSPVYDHLRQTYARLVEMVGAPPYRLTLGRAPTPVERERAKSFLRESPLSELCRALFNVNEFVYLD